MIEVPDASRRWSVPRLPAAKGRARVALPLVLGAAVLLGSLVWASGHLSERVEPPRERMVAARLDDWPEIRNGVPALKRAAPAGPSAVEVPSVTPGPRPAPAAAGPAERPAASAPAAGPPVSVGPTGIFDPNPFSSAAILGGTASSPEAEGADPPVVALGSGTSAASAPPAPETIEDARTAPPLDDPPAIAPVAAGMEPRREGGEPRRAGRGGQQAAAGVPPRPTASESVGKPKKPDTRQATRSERRRVAAAAPAPAPEEGPAASGPAPGETPATPDAEPLRVLGVPLPAGRRIKECLLELRC